MINDRIGEVSESENANKTKEKESDFDKKMKTLDKQVIFLLLISLQFEAG